MGDNDVNVTMNGISFYILSIIPNIETQVFFNEDITNSFSISLEPWTIDRRLVDTTIAFQINISLASIINSPLYLISAKQKSQRPDPANPEINSSNKRLNDAFLDHSKVGKYYSEVDVICYPKNLS